MTEKTQKIYLEEEVKKSTLEYFSGDTLATDVWIKKYCLKNETDYFELNPIDMHWRIANELARIESKYPNPLSAEEIFETLDKFNRIVPGGSPMSGIGNDNQITSISNCFVVGNDVDSDSYGGILKIDQDMVQLEKRRGGVGADLNFIRPAGSPVKNSAITSTGVVPFMQRYSNSTNEVAQDGRRGALMLTISIQHPDAESFIDAKLKDGKVTGANISVKLTDVFMDCVINNKPYLQTYPLNLLQILSEQEDVTTHKLQLELLMSNGEYDKIATIENKYGKKLGYVKKVDAKRLWKKIIHNAWKCIPYDSDIYILKNNIPEKIKIGKLFDNKEKYANSKILSLNLKTLKLENNDIIDFQKYKNNKKIIKIKTNYGNEFSSTEDHIFYVLKNSKIIETKILDINVGDYVLTSKKNIEYEVGNDYVSLDLSFFGKRDSVWFENEPKNLNEISIKKIIGYAGHPKNGYKLTQYIKRKGISTVDYLKIFKELETNGDIYIKPNTTNNFNLKYNVNSFEINKNFARFLGLWLADGSYNNASVRIHTNKKEYEYYKPIFSEISKLFNCTFNIDKEDTVYIYSKFLMNLMKSIGFVYDLNKQKQIPKFIHSLSKTNLSEFLGGLIDGDGTCNGTISLNQSNYKLLNNVKELLLHFNVMSNIREKNITDKTIKGKRVLNIRKNYILHISIESNEIFNNNINLLIPNKKNSIKSPELFWKFGIPTKPIYEILKKHKITRIADNRNYISKETLKNKLNERNINDDFLNKLINSDLCFDEVIEKGEDLNCEYVYDITVKNNHTFVLSNGVVLSNSAEPGILFWDAIINESIPDCYADLGFKTVSTNPCFSGKEKLLTFDGYKTFEELCGLENIEIINPVGNVVPTKVWCSGKKETVNVYDSQGNVMTCTPDHVWKTINDGDVQAKDLKGKKLFPYLYRNIRKEELFVRLGFIQGDGNLSRLKSTTHKGFEINIGKNDDDVLKCFDLKRTKIDQRKFYLNEYFDICKSLEFNVENLPQRTLPKTINTWSGENKLSFLCGLFSANGSIVGNYRIALKSTCKSLILETQKLLKEFDIDSYYTTNKSKSATFNNGDYVCKESYDLNIGKYYDLIKFYMSIGFIHQYKNDKLFNVIITRSPKITKIIKGDIIDVYDFTENETNWGVVNGCIAHNCGEIPLCTYDSCRLLSVNLFGYVRNPFTKNATFDIALFILDVVKAMRFMDDIVDLEIEKINAILAKIKADPEDEFIKMYETNLWERIKQKSIDGRRTGLGVTGEGDMIAAMGLRYGTDEANAFAEKIQKELKLSAYKSSVIMARERGAFPLYSAEREDKNPFILRIKDESPELYAEMQEFGRRNIALLTIAPTGSLSILTQTTSGCEPAFLPVYKRKRKINPQEKDVRVDVIDDEGVAWTIYPIFHHNFATWLKVSGYDVDVIKTMTSQQIDEIVKTSPYYKACSNDVDWVKKVEMQGLLQKHIDHSISVTVNLPNDATEEMVAKVYETGWRSGCKGMTVYRDGSRDGVLITDSEKKTKEKMEAFHDNHAPKRPKRLKGEIHRFQNNNEKWIAVVGLLDGRPYELFCGRLENGLSNLPSTIKECEIVKNIIECEEINENGKTIKVKKKRYDMEYVDIDGNKQIATGLSHMFDPNYWNLQKTFSGLLRHGMPLIYVHELIESLNLNDDNLNTWKNGIARVIKRYIKDGERGKGKCPNCGSEYLEYIEGCLTCRTCGNSKCG